MRLKPPVIQIALDYATAEEAIAMARIGVEAGVEAAKETGVWVVIDLIGSKNVAARAKQCETWGVNILYLHYGADQRRADASRDSVQWLKETQAAVKIPIGVGTFGVEDAVRAVSQGAELVAIGHPVISGDKPLEALKEYVKQVRAAYRPR